MMHRPTIERGLPLHRKIAIYLIVGFIFVVGLYRLGELLQELCK